MENLKKIAENNQKEFYINYFKGLEILNGENIPTNGIENDSSYYSIKGYDPDSKQVLFYKTYEKYYNNTEFNSSIKTA